MFGKIIWLKLALIEATNFISRHFVLMTFFKTVCFHTGQDKNQNTTKGLWKLKESFHPPFTLRINYINKRKKYVSMNMAWILNMIILHQECDKCKDFEVLPGWSSLLHLIHWAMPCWGSLQPHLIVLLVTASFCIGILPMVTFKNCEEKDGWWSPGLFGQPPKHKAGRRTRIQNLSKGSFA